MHRNIDLKHATEVFWCLNCHSTDERNYLQLLNGKKIPFEESYRLCGQCHGSIYRDWKLGIHGRRVGQWGGKKLYLLCAHCHDPHKPKFRKLPGKDEPRPPNYGRWETEDVHR
jgi:formate-dependent nitrite reductase cytochrome c552 subunit